LLSPFGGYWLAGRATRPLAQMNAMAATLRPDKVDERMPTRETGDELDQFSRTINGLLDRIAEYINQNRQFVANAAHELRSPLTAIQSSVEVTLNSQRTVEEYQELLAEVVEQCSDLRILVNQLLLLAESTAESPAGHLEPVALDQLARRAIEMFRDAAEEQGVRLYADHLDEVTLPGQESRLRQVINNLIDNGIKFNRPGGEVVLSIRNRGTSDEVELQICDTGIGIPAEDLQHIFKRFYRGDKSRHRDHHSSGNGLGLSICEAIINAHGGRVQVTSTLGESTCFRVWLKKSLDGTDR
jgi:signal transduction histidine kinase